MTDYPLSIFHPNPWNYNVMTEEEVSLLAQNIQSDGVKIKILVRPKNGEFEIIDGEQKIKALQRLGRVTIPESELEVREMTDSEVRRYVISSLLRGKKRDLIKEAELHLAEMQESKLNLTDYASQIGIDKTKLSRILSRLNIDEASKAFISSHDLSASVVDEIVNVKSPYRLRLFQRAEEEGWTEADVRDELSSGLTLDGESIKESVKPKKESDIGKLDLVERGALSQIIAGAVSNMVVVRNLFRARGLEYADKRCDMLVQTLVKFRKEVEGEKVVYPQNREEGVKRFNAVRDWLIKGSDDERKEKLAKVSEKVKEVVALTK